MKNKQIDFSQPQRQSAFGILVNGLVFLKEVLKAVIFPLILVFIKGKTEAYFYLGSGAVILLAIALIYGYFYYLRFTFYFNFDKNEFVVQKGVFKKSYLSIPIDKIQMVELNQSALQRLIGVYSLAIDTAGTEKKEAEISSISYLVAQELKSLLSKPLLSTQVDDADEYKNVSAPLVSIDTETLIRVGLTSNYMQSLGLIFGFSFAAYQQLKEFLRAFNGLDERFFQILSGGLSLVSTGLILVFVLIIMLGINLVRTVLKYYRFTLQQKDNSLLLSAGLFANNNTIIRPNKVQITTISQNYFQKKFNFSQLNFRQAHAGKADSESHQKQNHLQVPGCNPSERDQIIKLIFKEIPVKGKELRPNFRYLNLPIFFKVVVPLFAFWVICQFDSSFAAYTTWAIAYGLIVSLANYLAYRSHRLYVSPNYIIKQEGVWDISTAIIEPHKIQAIKTFQYPWHKNLDLGHVNLYTAAGTIHFKFGNYSEIKKLCNYWLFQVESSAKNWM